VSDLRISLGVRIEELRNALRLTRAQLAEMLGVDTRQIAAYELDGVWPGPEMAFELMKAFGIELRDLYDFTSTRVIPRISIEQRVEIRAQRRGARKRSTNLDGIN
jgi:transcriptional regulator with XRE-family HTH domain